MSVSHRSLYCVWLTRSLAVTMSVLNAKGIAAGTLIFKMEQVDSGAFADMKEAVPVAEAGMKQQQQFEDNDAFAQTTNTAARQLSDFEARWRPILDKLELLKTAGDHISEVRYSDISLFAFSLYLGASICKVGVECDHIYSDGSFINRLGFSN
jgi:hypothetical protein